MSLLLGNVTVIVVPFTEEEERLVRMGMCPDPVTTFKLTTDVNFYKNFIIMLNIILSFDGIL